MSALQYYKKSSIMCRMPYCEWYGHYKQLEHHFNSVHPNNKIIMDAASSCELAANKLNQQEKYLICNKQNIYWFSYQKGLFPIGASKDVEYFVSYAANEINEGEVCGPFSTVERMSTYFMSEMTMDQQRIIIYFEENTTEEYVDNFEWYGWNCNESADDLLARKLLENSNVDAEDALNSNGETNEDSEESSDESTNYYKFAARVRSVKRKLSF